LTAKPAEDMAKIQRRIKTKRVFSESIKRQAVKEFETGQYTVLELSKLYVVKGQTIYNWIKKYSPANGPQLRVVEMADSTDSKIKKLQAQVAELERQVGKKQLQIEFYEKMLSLAKEEYGIDLKKNSTGQP
jgi:transposase